MNENLYIWINELDKINFKVKGQKLRLIIDYLKSYFTEDLTLLVIELAIYCFNIDKVLESKSLIEIINDNLDERISIDSLQIQYNSNHNNSLVIYHLNNHNTDVQNFFQFLARYNYLNFNLLTILTFNQNGYIRFQSLKELTQYGIHLTISYFIFHVNDWVIDISQLSTHFLLENLDNVHTEKLLSLILSIEKLKNCKRQSGFIHQFVDKVDHYFINSDVDQLLCTFNRETDIKLKRVLLDYILKQNNLTVIKFIKQYYTNDYYMNQRIVTYLNNHLSERDYRFYLRNHLNPYQASLFISLTENIDELMPYIYHHSISIQRKVRTILKKLGRRVTIFDYLDELHSNNYQRRNILRGFIDISKKYELDILNQLLKDKDHLIRTFAFHKLCDLKLIEPSDCFLFLKNNLKSRIIRIIKKYKIQLSLDDLMKLYFNSHFEPVKRNLIFLITDYPLKDSLERLLTILIKEDNQRLKKLMMQLINIKYAHPLQNDSNVKLIHELDDTIKDNLLLNILNSNQN